MGKFCFCTYYFFYFINMFNIYKVYAAAYICYFYKNRIHIQI